MATFYVRKSGNDANNGLSPAAAKLTYTAAYTAASSGDTIYIGAGVYREASLTVSKALSILGDYDGAQTGDAGMVHLRGSAADVSVTAGAALRLSTGADGTVIRWLAISGWSSYQIYTTVAVLNVTITDCSFHTGWAMGAAIHHPFTATLATGWTIERCLFYGSANGIWYYQGDQVDRTINWTVRNCVFILTTQGSYGVNSAHGGGLVVENCTFVGGTSVIVSGTGTMTTPATMRRCIIEASAWWCVGGTLGFLVEDYNVFVTGGYGARSNVAVGANSLTRISLWEMRGWFAALSGDIATPWDVGADWQLANNAIGAAGYATDARGQTVLGANREVGALEYNADLDVAGGGGATAPPAVLRSPVIRGGG